jgi:hypothetical protein
MVDASMIVAPLIAGVSAGLVATLSHGFSEMRSLRQSDTHMEVTVTKMDGKIDMLKVEIGMLSKAVERIEKKLGTTDSS